MTHQKSVHVVITFDCNLCDYQSNRQTDLHDEDAGKISELGLDSNQGLV